MKYSEELMDDIRIVRIQEKKLTSEEAPEMKTQFLKLLTEEGEELVINLKEVEYMDSTGLGSLLFGIRQAERYDKDLVLCEVSSRIQSLIKIAHLENVLEIFETEKEAIKALQEDEV